MEGTRTSSSLPLSAKKSLKKERTRDCLSATSEHVSSSPCCKAKPLVVRRATSFTPGNPVCGGKVATRARLTTRVRLVSFQKDAQVVGHVPTRREMNQEDIISIWYSKDDFKEMKRQYTLIVKKLAKQLPLEEGEESRGLEFKTPRGCKSRQMNRYQAMDAVLDEQERQWELERRDADYIAQIYRQSSAHCQLNAYLLAKKDAEFVEQEKKPFCSEEPRNVPCDCAKDFVSGISKESFSLPPQTPEFRPASFRFRAPEESPTTPVRKEHAKKVHMLSPSAVLAPHLLRSL